jgi:hypothetical protein
VFTTLEAHAVVAVERSLERNLEFLTGKKADIKRKPHVTYVVLSVFI